MIGSVYLVGAGPGDCELITVKGQEAIKQAEVILYDRLVNPKLLTYASPNCEFIYCGKLPTRHYMKQEEINSMLIEKAREGKMVVRLKGGDPSIFGRVGEEAAALANHNIPYTIVPGITSGIAAPLYAGIPVTHRDYAGSFAMVTAHDKSKNGMPNIDWEGLVRGVQTVAFYMAMKNLQHICENLINHGKSPNTPVIVIRWGTWSRQESVVGTLATISEKVKKENITNPAITLVGEVVATREKLKWFEKKPLFGKQVVAIRGSEDNRDDIVALEAHGADVIEFPKWKNSERYIDNEIMKKLETYERILFMTTGAVTAFFSLLKRYQIDLRTIKAKLFCKSKTAIHMLEQIGLFAHLEYNMKNNGRLLLVGPKHLTEPIWMLDYHYGCYDYADVYQRVIDERHIPIVKRQLEDANPGAILFSSKASVLFFIKSVGKYGLSDLLQRQHIEYLCINKETKDTAKNHGLNARLITDWFTPQIPNKNDLIMTSI
ncbi:uroporphyrinogen-III C-methyltransferase [Metabacillus malikii]|uniref:uroporphyrinogen-III C-methyltransferase n=1 Tax=Metabacillus malikii TaxID=1504265 RepID=A0ABT9ZEX0_9BACI|nr:uroporphyrinogen-III C-methyltransferase [Metabacillus malikii]MDQ0230816.1 uroporphyrinogen III methyltransferase/synthase [Metabacillus malikii]